VTHADALANIPQGSPEWKALRCGRVTASKVADIVAKTKSGPSASRASYKADLVLERMTGVPREIFQTSAMLWGVENEAAACDAYAEQNLCGLTQIGFVEHPTIPMAGASPDRLVGSDGLVEAKCPQPPAHLETLLSRTVPAKYVTQIMWQFACMPERKWCDYISYHPAFPEPMRLFVQRIERDDALIAELEAEVSKFLAEVDETVSKLRAAYDPEQQREAA